nr:hypothetical protein [Tanacetum cinerariifolium]
MSPRSIIWGRERGNHIKDLCPSAQSENVITMARVLRSAINATRDNKETPKGNGCFEYEASGHFKRDCLKLRNMNGGAQGWVNAIRNAEKNRNAPMNLDSNVVMGTFLLNNRYASILFDTGADRSFISTVFSSLFVANENEKIDNYISGLLDSIYGNVRSSKPRTLDETIELTNNLMDQKLRTYAERSDNKRKANDTSRSNHGHQQQPFKKQNVAKVYNMGTGERKPYKGSLPKDNKETPKGNGCFEYEASGHFKRDCLKLRNMNGGAQGWVNAIRNAEKNRNAPMNLDSNVVMGTFLLNNR